MKNELRIHKDFKMREKIQSISKSKYFEIVQILNLIGWNRWLIVRITSHNFSPAIVPMNHHIVLSVQSNVISFFA